MIFLGVLLVGLPLAFFVQRATDTGWRPVTSLDALEEQDVIFIRAARVFVLAGDPPYALSAESPHVDNDPIAYCRSGRTFHELHGGVFDRRGNYLEGPPTRGMDRIATRVRDGVVEINVSMVTEGPPRGAESPDIADYPICLLESRREAASGFLVPPPPA